MSGQPDIFHGTKFWLSAQVPSGARFREEITKHGGVVVQIDKQADILIADHMHKKNIIPNSYSYTFIDQSVRNGRLENKEDHRVQPSVESIKSGIHINGSVRTTRTPFTATDDEFLLRFMVKNRHRPQLGNVIFGELAALNPRHTLQSWRDRWVRLRHRVNLDEVSAIPDTNPINAETSPEPPRPDPTLTIPTARAPTSTMSPQARSLATQHHSGFPNAPPPHRPSLQEPSQMVKARNDPNVGKSSLKTDEIPNRILKRMTPDQVERATKYQRRTNIEGQQENHSQAQVQTKQHEKQKVYRPNGEQDRPLPIAGAKDAMESESSAKHNPTNGSSGRETVLPGSNYASKAETTHTDRSVSGMMEGGNPPHESKADSKSSSAGQNLSVSNNVYKKTEARRVTTGPSHTQLNGNGHLPEEKGNGVASEMEATSGLDNDSGVDFQPEISDLDRNEGLVTDIWEDLLRKFGTSDKTIINDSISLIANARIIHSLKQEDFDIAWTNWWRTNPQRTEDEWIQFFNEFCNPFSKAHEQQFLKLYRERAQERQTSDQIQRNLDVSDVVRRTSAESVQASRPALSISSEHSAKRQRLSADGRSAVRGDKKYKRSIKEASPELGSQIYQRYMPEASPELGSGRKRRHLTPESPKRAITPQCALGSLEIPESPRPEDIRPSTPVKPFRAGQQISLGSTKMQDVLTSPEILMPRTAQKRLIIDESEDESDYDRTGQHQLIPPETTRPTLSPPTSESVSSPQSKESKRRHRARSELLGKPCIQSSVDRQLWSEEAEAQQSSEENDNAQSTRLTVPTKKSYRRKANQSSPPVVERDLKRRPTPSYLDQHQEIEETLFVTDDSGDNAMPKLGIANNRYASRASLPFCASDESDAPAKPNVPKSQIHMKSKSVLPAKVNGFASVVPEVKKAQAAPPAESDAEAESTLQDELQDPADWLEKQRAKGHDDKLLAMILNATTMQVNIANETLQHYLQHNNLPATTRGIWTAEDDAMLVQHSRKANRMLIKKHGMAALQERKIHLETMRQL